MYSEAITFGLIAAAACSPVLVVCYATDRWNADAPRRAMRRRLRRIRGRR